MSQPTATNRTVRPGDQLNQRRVSSIQADLNRTQRTVADNFRPPNPNPHLPDPSRVDHFVGTILKGKPTTTPGSNGSTGTTTYGADYTDARYYVSRDVPKQSLKRGDLFDTTAEVIPGVMENVTATNLVEVPGGTHTLKAGTQVQVFRYPTRNTTDGPAVDQYVFVFGGSGGVLPCLVTTDSGAGGGSGTSATWTYTVTDLRGNAMPDGSAAAATMKTPENNQRTPGIYYTAATPSTISMCCYDLSTPPALHLLLCKEADNGLPCASGTTS